MGRDSVPPCEHDYSFDRSSLKSSSVHGHPQRSHNVSPKFTPVASNLNRSLNNKYFSKRQYNDTVNERYLYPTADRPVGIVRVENPHYGDLQGISL